MLHTPVKVLEREKIYEPWPGLKTIVRIMRRGKDKRSLKMCRKKCLMNLDYLSELLKTR